jgi:hypothetical protein
MPEHFEQATELVTEDMLAEAIPCGPDLERHAEAIQEYADAGVDELYVHQILVTRVSSRPTRARSFRASLDAQVRADADLRAELLEHAQRVRDGPALGDLAIRDPVHLDPPEPSPIFPWARCR